MKAAKAKYGHKLRRHDPGFPGAVLLSSETDEFSIDEVVKEFDLEPPDGYFARSLAHWREHGRGKEDGKKDRGR